MFGCTEFQLVKNVQYNKQMHYKLYVSSSNVGIRGYSQILCASMLQKTCSCTYVHIIISNDRNHPFYLLMLCSVMKSLLFMCQEYGSKFMACLQYHN